MQQRSMFESEDSQPLAARMRPRTLPTKVRIRAPRRAE